MTFKQLPIYYHTLRFMKMKQICYRLFYVLRAKVRKLTKFSYSFNKESQSIPLKLVPSIESYTSYVQQEDAIEFTFLNLSHAFKNNIDWNFSDYGKLWAYNINYFEYLNQSDITTSEGKKLIEDFIKNISKNKDGLEPFPIALRGINWIKFLRTKDLQVKSIDDSLYAQYDILMDNLEYHLLGNHLLENGFSLLFGGYYFQDQHLFETARTILISELEEQILPDGAHFELTPMYHQIMLFRILDCINLTFNNHTFEDTKLNETLVRSASLMLGWLDNITYQNGNIPHFNDSTNGIAPSTVQLFDYAKSLGIIHNKLPLKECGYRKFIHPSYELVVDVGNIGPTYIPGHAHSDTFNFELLCMGKPLVVDSGISTYETNNQRNYERSTKAHNTVVIDDIDQSEVWSSLRVARRAKIIDLQIGDNEVQATHNGYLRHGYLHTRKFVSYPDSIVIYDNITDEHNRNYSASAYFHFDPGVTDITIEDGKIITNNAIFSFKGSRTLELVDTTIANGFNSIRKSKVICVKFKDLLETTINIIV